MASGIAVLLRHAERHRHDGDQRRRYRPAAADAGRGATRTGAPDIDARSEGQAAGDIKALHIKEIIVVPEYPYSGSPAWSPNGQAQLIAWLEGLLGQVPLNSHDAYFTYVWKHLPPISDIASGHVAYVRGAL